MTGLTAIDILIEPDETALARVRAENDRMRRHYADGFALDGRHKPHITLLQRYVRSACLDDVFGEVTRVIGSIDPSRLELRAVGIRHMAVAALPGIGLAGIVVEPASDVLHMQSRLITAVEPFAGSGGTPAAFATSAEEPGINEDTVSYVERYVPDHSGANYIAHMTVGLAPLDCLGEVESVAFDVFSFRPAGFAVFRLGNNGTATTELRSWREW